MKILVAFHWDYGRQGNVDGLFITTRAKLDACIGQQVYFGEILGKHSDVEGILSAKDFAVKSKDQDFIYKLEEIIGSDTISGYNPFSYMT